MPKITNTINIPFARDGDKVSIPDESSTGLVNKTQGFTSRYGEPPSEGGAYIKRESFNQILYTTQLAIQELQNLIITKVANKTPDVDGNITLSADDITDLGELAKMNQLNLAGSEIVGLLPSSKLTNASVTTDKIADASVTAAKLANASVTTAKLANASVTTDKIANASITVDKLAAGITNVNLPIGFIYIQFRSQSTPDKLFGTSGKWQDVSSIYDGDFLRVLGNSSEAFGVRQEEGLPNITGETSANAMGKSDSINSYNRGAFAPARSRGSGTGAGENNLVNSVRFIFDASRSNALFGNSFNVTPINSAIRVWKKIA